VTSAADPLPPPEPGEPLDSLEAVEQAIAHPDRPWYGPVVLAAFIGLVICTNIASGVWPSWINSRPEQLLMLSSRNRYLALAVANDVSGIAFVTIATLRLGAAALVCHLIGRAYGDRAIRWFTKFLGVTPVQVVQFRRGFDRAEPFLVAFFVGSNIVWALTGVDKTSWRRLWWPAAIGLAIRLGLIWYLANQFESELESVLRFLQRWQWPLIAISVGLLVLVNARNFRRGR
jgi:hypothetical protein